MDDIRGGSSPADSDGSTLHDVPGVQKLIAQIGQVADALSKDDALVQRVIDAVHSGSSAEVERVFTDIGVDSQVRVVTVDGADPAAAASAGATQADAAQGHTGQGDVAQGTAAMARATAPARTKTITVTIGIGPFSISVTVKKDSK
jgi:hypothetical protein